MDIQRAERALIGFVLGGLLGLGINYLYLWIYNQLGNWLGRDPLQFNWWSGIPFALIFGLSMAINMARPPFGD